jgi:hypothetical protein
LDGFWRKLLGRDRTVSGEFCEFGDDSEFCNLLRFNFALEVFNLAGDKIVGMGVVVPPGEVNVTWGMLGVEVDLFLGGLPLRAGVGGGGREKG